MKKYDQMEQEVSFHKNSAYWLLGNGVLESEILVDESEFLAI